MSESSSKSDRDDQGLFLVYTGAGKGKTTAALGLVTRAVGRGLSVGVMQFIKGKWKTGERTFFEELDGVEFLVMGRGFTWESDDLSQDKAAARAAWETCRTWLQERKHDVVVLDELTFAMNYGFLDEQEVLTGLVERDPSIDVIVTGRNAPASFVEAADLVSEMQVVKHPYEDGRRARPGVDY